MAALADGSASAEQTSLEADGRRLEHRVGGGHGVGPRFSCWRNKGNPMS